jgi:hypothetical protein
LEENENQESEKEGAMATPDVVFEFVERYELYRVTGKEVAVLEMDTDGGEASHV